MYRICIHDFSNLKVSKQKIAPGSSITHCGFSHGSGPKRLNGFVQLIEY